MLDSAPSTLRCRASDPTRRGQPRCGSRSSRDGARRSRPLRAPVRGPIRCVLVAARCFVPLRCAAGAPALRALNLVAIARVQRLSAERCVACRPELTRFQRKASWLYFDSSVHVHSEMALTAQRLPDSSRVVGRPNLPRSLRARVAARSDPTLAARQRRGDALYVQGRRGQAQVRHPRAGMCELACASVTLVHATWTVRTRADSRTGTRTEAPSSASPTIRPPRLRLPPMHLRRRRTTCRPSRSRRPRTRRP